MLIGTGVLYVVKGRMKMQKIFFSIVVSDSLAKFQSSFMIQYGLYLPE